jgi:hypothetical protein
MENGSEDKPKTFARRANWYCITTRCLGQIHISGDARGTTPQQTSSQPLHPVHRSPASNSRSRSSCAGPLQCSCRGRRFKSDRPDLGTQHVCVSTVWWSGSRRSTASCVNRTPNPQRCQIAPVPCWRWQTIPCRSRCLTGSGTNAVFRACRSRLFLPAVRLYTLLQMQRSRQL